MAVQEVQPRENEDKITIDDVTRITRESIASGVICGCVNCANHAKKLSEFWRVQIPEREEARTILNLPQPYSLGSPIQENARPQSIEEIPNSKQSLRDLALSMVNNLDSNKVPGFKEQDIFRLIVAKSNETTGKTRRSIGDTEPDSEFTTIFQVGYDDCENSGEKSAKESDKQFDEIEQQNGATFTPRQEKKLKFMKWSVTNGKGWDEWKTEIKQDPLPMENTI